MHDSMMIFIAMLFAVAIMGLGSWVALRGNEEIAIEHKEPPEFFKKLLNGDFGLPITYWFFGVLMGNIIGVLSRKVLDITSSHADYIQFLILIVVPYFILVSVGIWRASNKYKGSIVWANLSKAAVAISGIIILASFFNW